MKWLGKTVVDKITGFSGIVTGYVTYISGCNQCLIAPPVDKDGKTRDGLWLDEQRLIANESIPAVVLANENHAGFDMEPPVR